MPEISVIMPVYKVESFLARCIESVLGQTYTDFELILVDDGSPDRCGEICDAYEKRDPRIRVIHKQNEGVAQARNCGIRSAQGKWAYIMDSDDWLEEDALKSLLLAAKTTGADCVLADVLVHYPSSEKRGYLFSQEFTTDDPETIAAIQKFILCHKYSPYYTDKTIVGFAAPWSKLVRLSLVQDHQVFFDPYVMGRFDDGLWSLHLLDHCRTVAYIQKVIYNYRMLESSYTHGFKPQALDILCRGFERTLDWIEETGKDPSFLKAHYGRVCMFLALMLSQYFFHPDNPVKGKEARQVLRKTIQSEPFSSAIKKVDLSMLETKHRAVVLFARAGCTPALELYAVMKRQKVKRL